MDSTQPEQDPPIGPDSPPEVDDGGPGSGAPHKPRGRRVLPALAVILIVGLGLSTALGYSIWSPFGAGLPIGPSFPPVDQTPRVDDKASALIREGNRRNRAGEYEKALVSYRAAYQEAPDWSVANYDVAQALISLDRLREALPYAARAEKLEPSVAAWTAAHGYLLAKLQGPQAAWSQAETLRSTGPKDARDAFWMAELFDAIGDYEQELQAARAGLDLEPGTTYLAGQELIALVELNRLQEAGALVDKLGLGRREADEHSLSTWNFARELYQMRVNPLAGVRMLCASWKHPSVPTKEVMSRLIHEAERAGDIEATRAAVRRCLHDPETPGTAWSSAEPWFPDTWTEELDEELAEQIEPFPAILRLALYDPITEAPAIRRLAARIHTSDLFLAEVRDTYIFRNPLPGESLEQRIEALENHLETNPDHVVCRLMLAGMLVRTAPNRAAGQLEILDRAARDDPALAVALARERSEWLVGLDAAEQAVATIETVDPAGGRPYTVAPLVDLEAAEAAFHAGREPMLQERLARVFESDDWPAQAAALLIRWSDELATGAPITYREDVDRLLEQAGDSLLTSRSPSAQAILIAEGRPDARQREAWMPEEARGRLVLVRLFRDAAERGSPDLEAFARLADSPYPIEIAPLLAKTALARRRQMQEGS